MSVSVTGSQIAKWREDYKVPTVNIQVVQPLLNSPRSRLFVNGTGFRMVPNSLAAHPVVDAQSLGKPPETVTYTVVCRRRKCSSSGSRREQPWVDNVTGFPAKTVLDRAGRPIFRATYPVVLCWPSAAGKSGCLNPRFRRYPRLNPPDEIAVIYWFAVPVCPYGPWGCFESVLCLSTYVVIDSSATG